VLCEDERDIHQTLKDHHDFSNVEVMGVTYDEIVGPYATVAKTDNLYPEANYYGRVIKGKPVEHYTRNFS
jgi:hypothetical protein